MSKVGGATTGLGTGQYNATTPSLNDKDEIVLQVANDGSLLVKQVNAGSGSNPAAGATGSAVPADADYVGFSSGGNLVGVSAANPLPVSASFGAAATGGASTKHLIAAGSGDATSVKASAGTVYGWSIFNNGTVPIFVKLFNKASAPTLGTDTPVRCIGVQAGMPAAPLSDTPGLVFSTGIAFAIVTGMADNNSTGVSAGSVSVDLDYA
jgi:hypothetical protein